MIPGDISIIRPQEGQPIQESFGERAHEIIKNIREYAQKLKHFESEQAITIDTKAIMGWQMDEEDDMQGWAHQQELEHQRYLEERRYFVKETPEQILKKLNFKFN